MSDLFAHLGLSDAGTLVIDTLTLTGWGRTLTLSGMYQPPDDDPNPAQAITLTFREVRMMRWQVYAHIDPDQPTVAVVAATLGRDQHRSPAHLLTDGFGILFTYGALVVT